MSQFVPTMPDRHPWVQVVLGIARHGKSTYIARCLDDWRKMGRKSLAIDAVCPDPPLPKHIAAHASLWTPEPPPSLPPGVSLVACDEAALFSVRSQEFPFLRDCIFRGQHIGTAGVSCILGTQRAALMDRNAFSQARRVVIFRTVDRNDLQRLSELACMTPNVLALLPQLPPGYAVVWDDQDGIFVPYVPEWHKR